MVSCVYIVQVYEVLDNAIDEAQAGFATTVDVILHTDGSISISDDGRGVSHYSLSVFGYSQRSGCQVIFRHKLDPASLLWL